VLGGKERKKELWDAAAPVRKVQPEFAAAGKVRSGERSRHTREAGAALGADATRMDCRK
jgi:hypothetical protein